MKIIKDFDLLSPKWLDIAFEKKNKQYGAYELRNDSSNRHLKALIIVFIVGLSAIFLPKIVATMNFGNQKITEGGDHVMVDLQPDDQKPPEDQIQEEYVEPPPILIKTIQLVQIQVAEDDEVDPSKLETTKELVESNTAISNITNENGVDEGGARPEDVTPITNVVEDIIYDFVEVKAEFPGGEKELYRWLSDNLEYPIIAQENGIQGKVFVNFVVRSDGKIDNIRIAKGVHTSIDNAALAVVRKMKPWKPGQKGGKNVSSNFTLPVTFVLKQ